LIQGRVRGESGPARGLLHDRPPDPGGHLWLAADAAIMDSLFEIRGMAGCSLDQKGEQPLAFISLRPSLLTARIARDTSICLAYAE